jgi:effector-binding domain-containing protein
VGCFRANQVYAVQVRAAGPQPVAGIRDTVPTSDLVQFFADACREIHAYLSEIGVAVTGPPLSIWHSSPGEIPHGFDVETCIPVEHGVPARGRIRPGELAAGTIASTVHEGPYDDMGAAFDAVWSWIEAEGHEPAGPPRDVVLVGPDQTDDPAEFRTAIVYPIRLRVR